MNRRFYPAWIVVLLLVLQARAAVQDQSQFDFGSWVHLRPGFQKLDFAQTFQPGIAGRLECFLHSGESPTSVGEYPTTVEIVDVVAGLPGTNVLGHVVLTNISEQKWVYFTNQDVYLEKDVSYAVVVSTEAPMTTSMEYGFRTSMGNSYPRGELYTRPPGGAWSQSFVFDDPAYPHDLLFATYMEPGIPAVRVTQPVAGSRVARGTEVAVTAVVAAEITNATAVNFYASGSLLGNVSQAPYTLNWTPDAAGNLDLVAVLETATGESVTSSVCPVSVTVPRPENDDFAQRIMLNGEVATGVINQTNATMETGEAALYPDNAGHSVWWEWTPPRSAWATVSVAPATNALLGVFTGSQVDALHLSASGKNTATFLAEAGLAYEIAVDSPTNTLASGSLTAILNDIEITNPVPNMEFHAPASFTISAQRTATVRELANVAATANDLALGDLPGDTESLPVTLAEPGYYDLQLQATDPSGITTFSQKVPLIVRPANDDLAQAELITGMNVVRHTSNLAGTLENTDPTWAQNQGGHSLWYRWTAPADGLGLLDGRGTNFALLFNVCLGSGGSTNGGGTNAVPIYVVAANALAVPYVSLRFDVVGGKTYYFSVDGYFGEEGILDWSLQLQPYNDNFGDRRVLGGTAAAFLVGNMGASLEPGETTVAPSGASSSLWYSWQAPLSGTVAVQLQATNPVVVAVFTGSSLTGLVQVAQSTGGWTNSPTLTFTATAGATYQIAVFGQESAAGEFAFNLQWQGLRFASPLPNSIWPAPVTLPLAVELDIPGKTLQTVAFQVNGSTIANVSNAPYALNWTAPGPGTYTFAAHAVTTDTSTYDSVPLTTLVYTDEHLPRPRLYGGVQSDTSYVLNAVGALYLFGRNENQFGRTTHDLTSTPFLAQLPAGETGWKEISSTWAITDSGKLYQNGQTWIPFPTGVTNWQHVSCGYNGMVAVGDDGELYLDGTTHLDIIRPPGGWQDARASITYVNDVILGLGEDHEAYLVARDSYGWWHATLLPRPAGVAGWKAIAEAALYGVLLTDNGELWTYGMDSTATGFSPVPRPAGVNRWVDFAVGGFHILAIGDDSQLYAWGRNWEHQLGLADDQSPRPTPVMVPPPPGVSGWSAVAAGAMHSLAIGQDCGIYAWGENANGQLGQPASVPLARPTRVASIEALCGTPVLFTDGAASRQPDGSFRLRFNTDLNRTYLIQYSDDLSQWKNANGPVVGTGELVEWIDDGPPKTDMHPASVSSRIYRVIYAP